MTLHGPVSHTYFSQRLKLHYVDWGNESAPPLLLVHGGRDHCRSWDWVAEELRHDWHVIAPDLRGHGDSAWSPEGNYNMQAYIYDLAQLIHQLKLAPVTIVSHSLGGNICLRYTGLYPENVRKLVAIEGLGPSPNMIAEREKTPWQDRFRKMIEDKRALSGRQPKRYESLEQAYARMKEENSFLSEEQARHLTINGIARNEDGTYSWKFDNYLRVWNSVDITLEQIHELWSSITCPTLLLYGEKSWASDPLKDGRSKYFRNAAVKLFPDAGHWLHHDQFDLFMKTLRDFL
ncbi:alpha/beta hydrolase [Henriciella mobilis]|uniref:alpha/beta fold hydrolase n=1 Tax=Henriciella mobilis TaxID=2305467 RepID=UPI000E66E502|nr:alpha/beta hydrolase [Henriciella mobilis]RIJ18216.1 alpha/beta hydrolase [Henriciella mobilis]RIJ24977.1 alpha/beta hydrolase [Henriciella mobilis]